MGSEVYYFFGLKTIYSLVSSKCDVMANYLTFALLNMGFPKDQF